MIRISSHVLPGLDESIGQAGEKIIAPTPHEMGHDPAAARISAANSAQRHLIDLIQEYHDYNTDGICEYAYPSAVEFSKQVGRGRPCVYNVREAHSHDDPNGSMRAWSDEADVERRKILSSQAFSWTAQSLSSKVSDPVEVAVTPDGRADALYPFVPGRLLGHLREEDEEDAEQVFAQPATTEMSLSALLEILKPCPSSLSKERDNKEASTTAPVYYLQSQNSNLTSTALAPLLDDLPSNLPFAATVLGVPEAINIWIGDHRSVTSTHRDPYENLYLVLRGSKTFTLYAPVEELCLHEKMVRTGRLTQVVGKGGEGSGFRIDMDEFSDGSPADDDGGPGEQDESAPLSADGNEGSMVDTDGSSTRATSSTIPWSPISPLLPRSYLNDTYCDYKHAQPETITVKAGQMLYLPSGWFHHVMQQCGTWDDGEPAPCIAVNYWYDMDYKGERFVMRQMIKALVDTVRNG